MSAKAGFAEFVWIWNRQQGQETPDIHLRIARWLEARWRSGDRELLLLAFRASGKSTLVGLFAVWLLTREADLRILVLAADQALAEKMVRHARQVIERHPLAVHLRPGRPESWAADRFTVARPGRLRDPSMMARGIGANMTGSRADIVICDDVEVPNTCDTAGKRETLRTRLREIDYVLVPRGLQLYVGTPHSYHSIYADRLLCGTDAAAFLDGFMRLEIPLLDAGGQSAWPARYATTEIDALRRRTGEAKFQAQMLLRPVDVTAGRLDADRLIPYGDDLAYSEGNGEARLTLGSRRLVSASCWWDPAFGAPDRGDASVVAALYTDADGHYHLHRVAYLTHDPARINEVDEATQLCRQVADFAAGLHLPAVTVETNGLGRFLPSLLRRALAETPVGCAVLEVHSRRPKDLRIAEAFDAVLAAGALRAHESVWDTPFIREMREWRPGAGQPDDGLDAVAGCLLSEPVRLPHAVPPRRGPDWREPGAVQRARTDFEI